MEQLIAAALIVIIAAVILTIQDWLEERKYK
jgi:hypothetical protein